MNEEDFKELLEANGFSKEKVDIALSTTSPEAVRTEGVAQGTPVTQEVAVATARELRKKLAAEIAVRESDIEGLED